MTKLSSCTTRLGQPEQSVVYRLATPSFPDSASRSAALSLQSADGCAASENVEQVARQTVGNANLVEVK